MINIGAHGGHAAGEEKDKGGDSDVFQHAVAVKAMTPRINFNS
jgi:hypothetical protein